MTSSFSPRGTVSVSMSVTNPYLYWREVSSWMSGGRSRDCPQGKEVGSRAIQPAISGSVRSRSLSFVLWRACCTAVVDRDPERADRAVAVADASELAASVLAAEVAGVEAVAKAASAAPTLISSPAGQAGSRHASANALHQAPRRRSASACARGPGSGLPHRDLGVVIDSCPGDRSRQRSPYSSCAVSLIDAPCRPHSGLRGLRN